jgi:hypothetical protein
VSLWSKLRGTIETIFQLGLGGPNLKNNAGVVENRNAADAAFAIARGATPLAANDLTTKAYVDGLVGSGADVLEIRIAVALATVSSVTSIPIGAIVIEAELDVTTPYTGGATISLGQAGAVTEFQLTTDNNPQANGLYQVPQDTAAASTNPLLVTVAGGPVAGVATAIVRYVVTPQA